MTLTDFQEELRTTSRWDFSDLRALFVNCALKLSPELSNTEALIRISTAIMERKDVEVDFERAVDAATSRPRERSGRTSRPRQERGRSRSARG